MTKLSLNRKRLIVGIAFVVPALCAINYLLDLHAFGTFDNRAFVVSVAFLAVVIHYFGPFVTELREYRD